MANNNKTDIQILFESSTVHVEKEEEAYSIETLVADLGGVLGLFVGFNFLMVGDLIMFIQKRLKSMKIMSKGK